MFLNNSLISSGISNGMTGVITEILVDEDNPSSIHPIIVIPTENAAHVQ